MDLRQTVQIFWSVASLQSTLPELQTLVPALLLMIKSQFSNMTPQDVSNVVWGCAKLRLPPDQMNDMLGPLAEEAFLNADGFEPQHISNIVWSCGRMRQDTPGLMDLVPVLIKADAAQSLKLFKSRELANLCWGIALCNFK